MTIIALAGAAALALLVGPQGAQDASPEALSAIYGALPTTSLPDLSPDGERLARRVVHGGRYVLRIERAADGEDAVLWAPAEGAALERFSWTGDGDLLVVTGVLSATAKVSVDPDSGRRDRYVEVFRRKRPQVLTAKGAEVAKLTFRKLGEIDAFVPLADTERVSGELPVFVTSENGGAYGEAFGPARVRLDRNRYAFDAPPVKGSGVFSYRGDAAGGVILAQRRAWGEAAETSYLRVGDGKWQKLDLPTLDDHGVVAVEDARTLIVTGGETGGLHRFDLATGAVTDTLYEGPLPAHPLFAPGTGALVGTGLSDGTLLFRDRSAAERHAAAQDAIGEGPLYPVDAAHDGRMRLYAASPEGGPVRFHLWDDEAGAVVRTLHQYPAAAEAPRPAIRRVAYEARDGLPIEGFLSRPPDAVPGAPGPLVVLPHGGPASHDTPGFDYLREYLVRLGYAVFQPNFRGSTGYGRAFAAAGYREWGAKMQTDIEDGVAALVASGDADPDRLAIMGWSYGGYAALMGTLGETPYRCAVSINGVTDLLGMLDAEQTGSGFDYWAAHMGRGRLGEGALADRSPACRADEIDVPVLLVAGGLDTVVRKGQSAALEAAMEAAGGDVRAVYLMEGGHGLEREADRRRALAEAGGFLADCLPPA